MFDHFFKAVGGDTDVYNMPDRSGGTVNVEGVQRIRNFDFESGIWASRTGSPR